MSQSTDTYLLLLWEPFRVSPPGSPRPSAAPPPLPAAFGWPVTKARESHEDLQCRVIKGVSLRTSDCSPNTILTFIFFSGKYEDKSLCECHDPPVDLIPVPLGQVYPMEINFIYISPRGFWMWVVFLGALAFNSAHGTSGTIPGVELRVELKLWGPQTCLHPIFPGWIRRYLLNSGLEQQAWISMWAGHSFLGLSCGWP